MALSKRVLQAIPLPIRACPSCGAAGMRPLRTDEGGVPGANEISDRLVCPQCGVVGLALEFDDPADHAAFVEDLEASSKEGA